jgi:hypothetical protein
LTKFIKNFEISHDAIKAEATTMLPFHYEQDGAKIDENWAEFFMPNLVHFIVNSLILCVLKWSSLPLKTRPQRHANVSHFSAVFVFYRVIREMPI